MSSDSRNLEEQKDLKEFDTDMKDENEEAAQSERNCTLDELPNMNNPDGQKEINYVENLDDQEILKVNQVPVEVPRQEEILEIDEESDNFDAENEEIGNENYNANEDKIEDDKITGVESQNQNEEEEDLGRGKRRKSRNPQYFNLAKVNVLMSNGNQENEATNDKG